MTRIQKVHTHAHTNVSLSRSAHDLLEICMWTTLIRDMLNDSRRVFNKCLQYTHTFYQGLYSPLLQTTLLLLLLLYPPKFCIQLAKAVTLSILTLDLGAHTLPLCNVCSVNLDCDAMATWHRHQRNRRCWTSTNKVWTLVIVMTTQTSLNARYILTPERRRKRVWAGLATTNLLQVGWQINNYCCFCLLLSVFLLHVWRTSVIYNFSLSSNKWMNDLTLFCSRKQPNPRKGVSCIYSFDRQQHY